MAICDENDILTSSDNDDDDVGGPDRGNPFHEAKAKYIRSKGKRDGFSLTQSTNLTAMF